MLHTNFNNWSAKQNSAHFRREWLIFNGYVSLRYSVSSVLYRQNCGKEVGYLNWCWENMSNTIHLPIININQMPDIVFKIDCMYCKQITCVHTHTHTHNNLQRPTHAQARLQSHILSIPYFPLSAPHSVLGAALEKWRPSPWARQSTHDLMGRMSVWRACCGLKCFPR